MNSPLGLLNENYYHYQLNSAIRQLKAGASVKPVLAGARVKPALATRLKAWILK